MNGKSPGVNLLSQKTTDENDCHLKAAGCYVDSIVAGICED